MRSNPMNRGRAWRLIAVGTCLALFGLPFTAEAKGTDPPKSSQAWTWRPASGHQQSRVNPSSAASISRRLGLKTSEGKPTKLGKGLAYTGAAILGVLAAAAYGVGVGCITSPSDAGFIRDAALFYSVWGGVPAALAGMSIVEEKMKRR